VCRPRFRRGFTLIELMIVIGVIAILMSLTIPVAARVRAHGKSAACKSNLRCLGVGLLAYQQDNADYVVPSYNMRGTAGGADCPLDGWAPILDRDKVVPGNRESKGNVYACPAMLDVEGVKTGQTGTDPDNPKGYMEWPNLRMGTEMQAVAIPQWGFDKIIRVGYWINADNPIGALTSVNNGQYYTASAGYGPGSNGVMMKANKASVFSSASTLIVLADGVYAGKHSTARIGTANCRIGYRHPGGPGTANLLFADTHVNSVDGNSFPRTRGAASLGVIRSENAVMTVYANVNTSLAP
jgi:prepilin-type N-terminal cleavage/methylation domain-containing protein/prepilin-type processing-associated H-X9-DG protein